MVPAISVPTTTWAPGSASSRPSARIVAGAGRAAGFCARPGAETQARASAATTPRAARTVMVRDFMATSSLQKSSCGDARFGEQFSVGDVQHPITDGAHPRVMGDDEQGAVLPAGQPAGQLHHLTPPPPGEVGPGRIG